MQKSGVLQQGLESMQAAYYRKLAANPIFKTSGVCEQTTVGSSQFYSYVVLIKKVWRVFCCWFSFGGGRGEGICSTAGQGIGSAVTSSIDINYAICDSLPGQQFSLVSLLWGHEKFMWKQSWHQPLTSIQNRFECLSWQNSQAHTQISPTC